MNGTAFEAPLPLPGLQRSRSLSADDGAPPALRSAAELSLRRSSAAARALATGAPLIRRELDDESGLGDDPWPHGRFPAGFADPTASAFEKAVVRAARDEDAFARLVSPLVAASALRRPRSERAALLAAWPQKQREPVRNAFAWLRAQETRLQACKVLPEELILVVECQDASSIRRAAACAIGRVFARWWSEELFVLDPTCAWLSIRWSTDETAAGQISSWWMTTEPTWA